MESGQQKFNGGFHPDFGLYHPGFEHDGCGVGFLANIDGTGDHQIIEQGVAVLKNLMHRGAVGGDLSTGDGAGILVRIPDDFLRNHMGSAGRKLPPSGAYGVAMVFLPRDPRIRDLCAGIFERICEQESLRVLGWREVPVDLSVLGEQAGAGRPTIFQCAIDGVGIAGEALDRKLFVARRCAEKSVREQISGRDIFYIPSMSTRTVVYKGLMRGDQLPIFYPDLHEPDFTSPFAVVHQRYSTNTFPSWELAQPFRFLAHNGEINTLRGNINHMRSRESTLESPLFGADIKKILPIIDEKGSDSACLDNALELLLHGGRSLPHAMLMLVPEAWGVKYPMGPDQRGFFEYHAGLMEPWDGPAALAFSDGGRVGAMLDRNGLRPGRYSITRKGRIIFASEAGVLDLDPSEIVEKGALRPGRMILVDFEKKRVLKNGEIKTLCARHQPYRRWVEENKITVRAFYGAVAPVKPERESLTARQRLFGYTREELQMVLEPMASRGYEPVGSMGADIPPAVLSEKNQLLYSYFKQLFAQVTNPAIDPVREELVMTLMTFIGNPGNILSEMPAHARLIKLVHPILADEDLERIRNLQEKGFRTTTVKIGFQRSTKTPGFKEAISTLCAQCERASASGVSLILLSDRDLPPGMVPVPALLAVSAVNQHLARCGRRPSAGILVETGEARDVMHMALLLGYGATAINPYLAFQTVAAMCEDGHLSASIPVAVALENYIKALCRGLLKIMSKMGISTLRSYRGAQVFEAIGLNRDVVDDFFPGTASRIEGIGLDAIAAEAAARFDAAESDIPPSPVVLPSGGEYRYRVDGERHLWTPEAIRLLQEAVRRGDMAAYSGYAELINQQAGRLCTLRGMFSFKERPPVPLEEVEPASSIMTRFVTGAMSFGSISREAHQTIAVAMNRIKAMSNCGEGGEDPSRYRPLPNGDSMSSAVKQVASGRFGVTIEYLVNGKDLQIKIAQGAKPGEGGQ
ncbi:MAG TPA: glutamate synthase subunit alpha, partial [Desulfobacteraceae bacterium]|nr:glutamate synthase subunit alpha [Desulfobacteraceae bacterium]